MARCRLAARRKDILLYLGIFPNVGISCHSPEMLCCLNHAKKTLSEQAGILIFLKHFDTTKQTLSGSGKILVPRTKKVGFLVPIINERMGWESGTPLKLYEVVLLIFIIASPDGITHLSFPQEIKPGMVEFLEPSRTLSQSGIVDGDIICFQMIISDEEARNLESQGLYSNPLQFYDFLQQNYNCS